MNDDGKWIDEDDLTAYSGLSRSYWQKQRLLGTGPAYSKIGRAVRYRFCDVVAYLESHKIKLNINQQGDKQ